MKLDPATITIIEAAAAVPTASISPATLQTVSSNKDLDGFGLSNIHEGAALNGVYLSQHRVDYSYNKSADAIFAPDSGIPSEFNLMRVFDQTLIVGVAGDTIVRPLNGYLTVNGSADVFYACKPGVPYDPYRYSESSYGVAVFASGDSVPETCENIKIRAFV